MEEKLQPLKQNHRSARRDLKSRGLSSKFLIKPFDFASNLIIDISASWFGVDDD